MAAIDFPSSPTNGQLFNAANSVSYRYVTPPGIWTVANGPVDTVIASDTPPSNPAPNQLWFNASLAMLYVFYDDGNSQQWVPSMPVPAPTPPSAIVLTPKFTNFLAGGTWTPDPKMIHGFAVGMGGGQGGGGQTGAGGYVVAGGGGLSGSKVTAYFKAPLAASYVVTVGGGGVVNQGTGGNTTIAGLLTAPGGGSATAAVGNVYEPPLNGGHGMILNIATGTAYGAAGGGRGGGGVVAVNSGSNANGLNGTANSGGGGGGAAISGVAVTNNGGAGGSGYAFVVEYVGP